MNKIFKSLIFIFVLAFAATAFGASGMNSRTPYADSTSAISEVAVQDYLSDILASQGIASVDKIDCNNVSDDQLEKLGDAYMELIHPGDAHEYMDNVMGGEGSSSLRAAHINMGRSYLGCWANYNSGPAFMPMMNSGSGYDMTGGWFGNGNGYFNLRGYGSTGRMLGFNFPCAITFVLVWLFLITGSLFFIKGLRKK